MQNKDYTILAIDPGYERLGIAVIKKQGSKETLLFSECFHTPKEKTHGERLAMLALEVEKVIAEFAPDDLAIETLFFNDNTKTAIKVAEARGVVIAVAAKAGLTVYEYGPLQIKIAVTGYGRSAKDAVITMVKRLIAIPEKKKIVDDEFDAIAVGLTHGASKR